MALTQARSAFGTLGIPRCFAGAFAGMSHSHASCADRHSIGRLSGALTRDL